MAGSKRKTGNNKWRLEYMLDGERYSQYVTASSPYEADKKLALFVSEIEKGTYSKESNLTFVEMAQMLRSCVFKNRSTVAVAAAAAVGT